MGGEIITFPKARAAGQVEGRLATPAAVRLDGAARLEPDVRERLARRLGQLCALLDPDDPRAGARRLFDEAFGAQAAARWRRRRRLVRLPDEAGREGEGAIAFEASAAPYLSLAHASSRLYEGEESSGDAEAARWLLAQGALTPAPALETRAAPQRSSAWTDVSRLHANLAAIKAAAVASPVSEVYRILASAPLQTGPYEGRGVFQVEIDAIPPLRDTIRRGAA